MVIHNAKIDKPPKSGDYLTFHFFNLPHFGETMNAFVVAYDKKYDGWNIGWNGNRECEVHVDAWAELPTADKVKGALYVQDIKG